MSKNRFWIDVHGTIKADVQKVIAKATVLSESKSTVILLLHAKNSTGFFRGIFSESDLTRLQKDGITLEKYKLKIESVLTLKDDNMPKIICSFGLKSDELYQYDDYTSVSGIVAYPWNKGSLNEWAALWQAPELNSNTTLPAIKVPDPVVVRALEELTNEVNLSTGISHHLDESRCKTFLRALHHYKYVLNEEEIFSYLASNGWTATHAKDVVAIVEKLNQGKKFRGGDTTGLKEYVERWKS